MERLKIANPDLNHNLRLALFFWQADPESQDVKKMIGDLFERATCEKFGMDLKIKAEFMENSEGRRAILVRDLRKYARHEGNFFIFNFEPKKEGTNGNAKVRIVSFNGVSALQILNNEWGTYSQQAIFFPHEIAEIKLHRKK